MTELDRWLYLLKNLSKLDNVPAVLKEPVYGKVIRIAEVCNLNRQEKMAWDAYLKVKWDNENSDEYAKKVATREGREEGLKEGRNEGREEGKLEIVRNMKAKGFDIETISEITGLTPEEIRNA